MYFSTMQEWLNWINSIHFSTIELGLERVKQVALQLKLLPLRPKTIIVGGTNGKGSTVAALEAIYRAQGYNVGCYTSPVLYKHNEQVRVNGVSPPDEIFCQVFAEIENHRAGIRLTPFEYHTLAALMIFEKHPLDLVILEVGMGGRLDAVNIVDADIAILTSIDLDHMDWLGHSRAAIAMEKTGIFRAQKPAICGDIDPPPEIAVEAKKLNADLYQHQKEFGFEKQKLSWNWQYQKNKLENLPYGFLATHNLSTALMAIELTQLILPVTIKSIKFGIKHAFLPGRLQIIHSEIPRIFDVAHNPAAVRHLVLKLKELSISGQIHAVFSMLSDKDIEGCINVIQHHIDKWYIAGLSVPRAATKEQLELIFENLKIENVSVAEKISHAYREANSIAKEGDCVIVFGSFHTVAQAWQAQIK